MIHFNPHWTIQIYLLGVILGFYHGKQSLLYPVLFYTVLIMEWHSY